MVSCDRCSPSKSTFIASITKVAFDFLMVTIFFFLFTNGIMESLFFRISFIGVYMINLMGH